jgi:MFS family permease
MASPNPPPFSETFQKASSLRSPTLVGDKERRKSSYFANGSPGGKHSPNGNTPPDFELDAAASKAVVPPVVKQATADSSIADTNHNGNKVEDVFARLSPIRKNILLAVFSLATALDVVSVSGLLTTTESISKDLGLTAGNITWILTAYAMTFASFLLLAGRLADLYPAQLVFEGGFVTLAIFFLVCSFVDNKYGFLVLRALQGISASMTIPSAYHLIVHLFPEKGKQQNALAMLGLIAAIANTLGVVLGGLFELASWKWLFRFMAILAFASAGVGALLLPWKMERHIAHSEFSKLQRLDLVGVFLMTGSLLLFILGLTSGTTEGWTHAQFLAPFLISVVMFCLFFVWESRLHEEKALLPMKLIKLPNLILLCFMAMTPYLWWGTVSLSLANYYQVVLHHSAILAAARILPIGVAGLIGGMLPQFFPVLLSRPKWTVIGGTFIAIVPALVLLILGDGGHGNDYWKYMFTGCAIGSFGMILTFLALNIGIIQAVPPEASGVAGALLQVSLQIGSVIGLSVQAGLYSRVDNDLSNWKGTQYGYYFDIAWLGVSLLAFIIFYRPDASRKVLSELQEKDQAHGDRIGTSEVSAA